MLWRGLGTAAGKRRVPVGEATRPGEHHRPRGIGGTHPGRSSCVRNAVTPSRSGRKVSPGKPTARRAQSLGGNRMTEKPNAGSGNATGNRDQVASPSSWRSRITGRIPGLVPGLERVLTRSGEPVKRKMTEIPEPEDKLDATTATAVAVSGPEDDAEHWRQIDWRRVEADVRRL